MKIKAFHALPVLRVSLWILLGYLTAATSGRAQLVDVTDLSAVRTSGTYTYYSEQTSGAASWFTTKFYPGPTNHDSTSNPTDRDGSLDDSISTAGAISIGSGELTDYTGGVRNTATNVSGFVGVTSNLSASTTAAVGSVDLIFDLGAVYNNISEIVVNYTDSVGHRYSTVVAAQSVYYGLTAPNATSTGGLTLLGTSTATANGTAADMTFTATTPVSAEFIDIRLAMSVAGSGTGSVGGYINSVQILAVPEPSTLVLLMGFLPVVWFVARRGRAAFAA